MKKFLLMFAAVAAIAFVGCKTETKPAEEVVEEAPVAEYTVDGVAADLMNCADEAAAVSLLDGIKAKAEELLNGGDEAGFGDFLNVVMQEVAVINGHVGDLAEFDGAQAMLLVPSMCDMNGQGPQGLFAGDRFFDVMLRFRFNAKHLWKSSCFRHVTPGTVLV